MINNVELVVVSSQCRQTTVVNNFGEFLNFILIPVVYGDRVKLEKKRKKKKKKRSNVEEILVSRSQLLYRFDMLHLFTSCGQFGKSSPRALIAETKKNLNSVGIPSYSIPFWYRVFSLGSYKKRGKKTRMELRGNICRVSHNEEKITFSHSATDAA